MICSTRERKVEVSKRYVNIIMVLFATKSQALEGNAAAKACSAARSVIL
jgi:hypothetical protein